MSSSTESFKSVAAIEKTLQEDRNITESLRAEVTESTALKDGITLGATVQIHATIIKPGESSGVVKVGEYSAADLYQFAEIPVTEFCRCVSGLIDALKVTAAKHNDVVAFELGYIDFWSNTESLKSFLGLSPGHNEFVSVLLTLSRSEGPKEGSLQKVNALIAALSVLRNKLVLSETSLDDFEDKLEAAGFDLNAALSS